MSGGRPTQIEVAQAVPCQPVAVNNVLPSGKIQIVVLELYKKMEFPGIVFLKSFEEFYDAFMTCSKGVHLFIGTEYHGVSLATVAASDAALLKIRQEHALRRNQ